jgi:hypothetical protein
VRLLEYPDALRDFDVEPVIVDGFAGRGPDFSVVAPPLHLVHWTAGSRTGTVPSLRTVTFGRPDLPYNLCQILQSREGGTLPDKAYCVSAGRAVHAGEGVWLGVERGNSNGTGNEIEWSGPAEPFPGNRYDTTVRIAAASIKLQMSSSRYVPNHREYALPPGRKVDTNLDGLRLRRDIESLLGAPIPTPPGDEEDDMEVTFAWFQLPGVDGVHLYAVTHAKAATSAGPKAVIMGGTAVHQTIDGSWPVAKFFGGETLKALNSRTTPFGADWAAGIHFHDGPLKGK